MKVNAEKYQKICPSEQMLIRFHRDLLSKNEKKSIKKHLQKCEICADTLAGILAANMTEIEYKKTVEQLNKKIDKRVAHKSRKAWYFRALPYAAAIALLFTVGQLFFIFHQNQSTNAEMATAYEQSSDDKKSDLSDKLSTKAKNIPPVIDKEVENEPVSETISPIIVKNKKKKQIIEEDQTLHEEEEEAEILDIIEDDLEIEEEISSEEKSDNHDIRVELKQKNELEQTKNANNATMPNNAFAGNTKETKKENKIELEAEKAEILEVPRNLKSDDNMTLEEVVVTRKFSGKGWIRRNFRLAERAVKKKEKQKHREETKISENTHLQPDSIAQTTTCDTLFARAKLLYKDKQMAKFNKMLDSIQKTNCDTTQIRELENLLHQTQ